MSEKKTRETLLAQEYVFSLFARVFGVQPDEGLIEDLASSETQEALSVF